MRFNDPPATVVNPELWEWMFSLGLYLNWDASHLMWIGIDPVETILPYAQRILHAQAKDVEFDTRAQNRYAKFRPIRGATSDSVRPSPWVPVELLFQRRRAPSVRATGRVAY